MFEARMMGQVSLRMGIVGRGGTLSPWAFAEGFDSFLLQPPPFPKIIPVRRRRGRGAELREGLPFPANPFRPLLSGSHSLGQTLRCWNTDNGGVLCSNGRYWIPDCGFPHPEITDPEILPTPKADDFAVCAKSGMPVEANEIPPGAYPDIIGKVPYEEPPQYAGGPEERALETTDDVPPIIRAYQEQAAREAAAAAAPAEFPIVPVAIGAGILAIVLLA